WNLAAIERLLPAAFSMAMLGAIESLLCVVLLDGCLFMLRLSHAMFRHRQADRRRPHIVGPS
ncbi:hypothetical protein, partial [Aeromonas salmonicida]|uniref:hypothetical protein n=1 Tax=Aeromonas salmonicida TaxID=645 RepID=UPI003D31098E